MFDILIKNGKIFTGTGNPWIKTNIAINNGKIAEIGSLKRACAHRVIDASELVVGPGFIDIHNHSDLNILINPKAESFIRQGVTTLVFPNCGGGLAPLNNEQKMELRENNPEYLEAGLKINWETYEEYLQKLESRGSSVNVAPLIGYGTVRKFVMGYRRGAPTDEELSKMKKEVEKAMKAGAFGISTGLRYTPQVWAETEEIIEICKVVAKYDGIHTSHIRDEGDRGDPVGAVQELIKISEKAGLPGHIAHFKILAKPFWKDCQKLVERIKKARENGLDITADQYPYTASGTSPFAWIPEWAREGRNKGLLKRLQDSDTRTKIKNKLKKVVNLRGGSDAVLISSYPLKKEYIGKTVAEVAETLGKNDSIEVILDLLQKYLEKSVTDQLEGTFGFINFNMSEKNVKTIMRQPWVMTSSDGRIHAPYGPLLEASATVHPRYYGAFPRMLRKYVREKDVVQLRDALRKMTSLPAQRLGIHNRGILAEGMCADITLFHPQKVKDTATYVPPKKTTQYPQGIPFVIVNGKVVIDQGEHTGCLAGKILKRKET